jgi:hypothetical protein
MGDHRVVTGAEALPASLTGASTAVAVDRSRQNDALDHRLPQIEVGRRFQRFFHHLRVQALIRLSARRLHCRSFALVEQTDLNERAISHAPHQPAKGVDFTHQMSLRRAANRWIARHMRQFVEIDGQQQCAASHARCGMRRFASGVPCADNNDIVDIWMDTVHRCVVERLIRQYCSKEQTR